MNDKRQIIAVFCGTASLSPHIIYEFQGAFRVPEGNMGVYQNSLI